MDSNETTESGASKMTAAETFAQMMRDTPPAAATTPLTVEDAVERVASGAESEDMHLSIYWDAQDPSNIGPAYRFDGGASGALEFSGWAKTAWAEEDVALEHEGMDACRVSEYFDADGQYLGPDMHGIYPTFDVE